MTRPDRKAPSLAGQVAARRPLAVLLVLLALILALAGGLLVLDKLYPPPLPRHQEGQIVTDRSGHPLRLWPDSDEQWRYPVTPETVSPLYLQTLLAYEDQYFYWHPGVNPYALLRAAWQWWRHGHKLSGGSTLTMQVARLLDPTLEGNTRSPRLKLRQILRALQLEWRLDKNEILTLYLNHAPMGGPLAGVGMGSQQWLGKSPEHLTQAEAALLTALPRAPSLWRPDRYPKAAQQARDAVLQRLVERGRLSPEEAADAAMENILPAPLAAPWQLAPLAGEHARRLRPGQSVIHTTLDRNLQARVARLVEQHSWRLHPSTSIAVLVLHNPSAELRAYQGTAMYGDRQRAGYVDMTQAWRSPGSTLKPLLYGLALDEGLIHSHSLLLDVPRSFGGYRPGNFQASYRGPVTAAEALARSLNIPAVEVLERYGASRFHARLEHGGLPIQLPLQAEPNLSLILGGGAVRLYDLVGIYRALGHEGLAARPRLLPEQPLEERRLLSPGAAHIVRRMLQEGLPGAQQPPGMVWKTGTSFGFRDAWAIGIAGDYTIGVWVGRPDGTPNPGHMGADTAAPLWQDIARPLRFASINPGPPASVSTALICWPDGRRLQQVGASRCATRHTAWLLDDTAPPTAPATGLQVIGPNSEGLLRPSPGQQHVLMPLQVRGGTPPYRWWLNGEPLEAGNSETSRATLHLATPGLHTITVIDDKGAWRQARWTLLPTPPALPALSTLSPQPTAP